MSKRERRRQSQATRGRPRGARPSPLGSAAGEVTGAWSERGAALHALGVALAAFAVYWRTLCPTVAGGDNSELVMAAHDLGVAHPPGYPLFLLLTRLFMLLPFGEIAWRANLMSAVCDAVAAGMLTLAVARVARNAWAGVLAGGLFAFSPLVWSYAVVAEVHALHNLFVAGLLLLTARFADRRDLGTARVGALWVGLGASHHHAFAFYALPCVLWVLWHGRAVLFRGPGEMLRLAGLALGGLAFYLYLPWASSRDVLASWGNQTTWSGFWTHFFRTEYGTLRFVSTNLGSDETTITRLGAYLRTLPDQMAYLGPFLAALGLAAWLRRAAPHRGLLVVWACMCAAYIVAFAALANLSTQVPFYLHMQSRFWQQHNLVLVAFAGLGLATVGSWLGARRAAWARAVVPAVALLLPLVSLLVHYRAQDQSRNRTFEQMARATLQMLPPGALLVMSGDGISYVLRYHQRFHGLAPTVRLVDHVLLTRPWSTRLYRKHLPSVVLPGAYLRPGVEGCYDLRAFLEANLGRSRGIYLVNSVRIQDDSWSDAFVTRPLGLVEVFLPKGSDLPLDTWIETARAMTALVPEGEWARFPEGTWEEDLHRLFWRMRYAYGVRLAEYSNRRQADRVAAEEAVRVLEEVAASPAYHRSPELFPKPNELYRYLGLAYQLLATHDRLAYGPRMIRAWRTYVAASPVDDPELPMIRAVLAAAEADLGRSGALERPEPSTPR